MTKLSVKTARSVRGAVVPTALGIIAVCFVGLTIWSVATAQPSAVPWSDLMPAIVGGAIGALAGGIPSYFIARLGSRQVLARDEAERIDKEKSAAFRAHVRVAELVNAVLSLQRQLDSMMAEAAQHPRAREHPWLVVRPFAGLTDERRVTVDPAEAAVFMAARAADFVNDLLLLPRRYGAVVAALAEYARRREWLSTQMPPVFFEGELGSSFLDEEQQRQLMPRMVELNSILFQAQAALREDAKMALKLAREFGPIMKRHFDDSTFPGFNLDAVPADENETAASPSSLEL